MDDLAFKHVLQIWAHFFWKSFILNNLSNVKYFQNSFPVVFFILISYIQIYVLYWIDTNINVIHTTVVTEEYITHNFNNNPVNSQEAISPPCFNSKSKEHTQTSTGTCGEPSQSSLYLQGLLFFLTILILISNLCL